MGFIELSIACRSFTQSSQSLYAENRKGSACLASTSRPLHEISLRPLRENQPLVCFGSFQDFLGKNTNTGGIKTKNEWVHATVWDCIIFDEYHFGAWRENAKDLFGKDLEAEKEIEEYKKIEKEGIAEEDKAEHLEKIIPISTNHYLYLSGTPFRAISSGEFIEEQIFN